MEKIDKNLWEMGEPIALRILLLHEDGAWVAQCLEFDVCGQGDQIDDALFSLEAAFVGQILLDARDKREPMSFVKTAPQRYVDLYEHAKALTEKRPFRVPERDELPAEIADVMPPLWMKPSATADVRVC